jgi:hypothetical protein
VEFLAELLAPLLQLLGEVLLQCIGEALAELGWYSIREAIRPSRPPRRAMALIGHALIGIVLGALSLLIFPKHFAVGASLRAFTLFFGPFMSALAMVSAAGFIRRYRPAIDTRWWFGNAYLFGLLFALVRYLYAH